MEENVKAYASTTAAKAVNDVNCTVTVTAFQAAVAGSSSNSNGTAGSYTVQITMARGEATGVLNVIGNITPTVYKAPLTYREALNAVIPTFQNFTPAVGSTKGEWAVRAERERWRRDYLALYGQIHRGARL